jgi:hypothetical protein
LAIQGTAILAFVWLAFVYTQTLVGANVTEQSSTFVIQATVRVGVTAREGLAATLPVADFIVSTTAIVVA